jgi:NAD(P)H dehydrogenase (quinone)
VASGALIGSAKDGKIASATREDYADAAVAVLTGNGHVGKIYECAGDDAYTLSDLAAEISRHTGKAVVYNDLPAAEYAAILASFGVPEGFAHAIAGWDVAAAHGALFDSSKQLSTLIGRPTTPLATSVAALLK